MAFCSKCGTEIQDGAKFCPSCGQPAVTAEQAQAPPVVTVKPGQSDAEVNKGMAIIAYILFFIPLLTGDYKKSPFVKYHTNQGTLLFFLMVAYGIVQRILVAIFAAIFLSTYTLGALGVFGFITTILGLLWLVPLALLILGIINVANGQMKPLPIIGKYTVIK